MITLFIVISIFLADSDKFYEPLRDKLLKNIVRIEECEKGRFVIGLDENYNNIIDACYSLKYIGDELHYKRVDIVYYIIKGENKLYKQGCVCD